MEDPAPSAGPEMLYAEGLDKDGDVWDLTPVWAHRPEAKEHLVRLFEATAAAGLTQHEEAVVVLEEKL